MITTRAKEYLDHLKYNENAKRLACIVPLGGIYWNDEIPDLDAFTELPGPDRDSILRLFSIRFQIWENQDLSDDDAQYWNEARSQLPHCPIFRRLKLRTADRRAQKDVLKDALQFFDAIFSGATDSTIGDTNGITKISVTHKLKDEVE